jgi:hypothetical protein
VISKRNIILTIGLVFLLFDAFGQDTPKMSDFTIDDLVSMSSTSYLLNGSTYLTAGLLFQGFQLDKTNIRLIATMADFFTESEPRVAAVVYYYLYSNIGKFDEKSRNTFMIMFSDAMYQFGLSKHKSKKGKLKLGDLMNYNDFIFDIDGLKQHSDLFIAGFGSIEEFIYTIENTLGVNCGFVEKSNSKDINRYLPGNILLTSEYSNWLNSYPEGIDKIRKNALSNK